jgi:hypothetical protein
MLARARAALRAVRSGVRRLDEVMLVDFTRVGRRERAPLDASELAYRLSAEELGEVEDQVRTATWDVMQDKDFGGSSECSFALSGEEGGKAVFRGSLSTEVGGAAKHGFHRSGYCAVRSTLPLPHEDVSDYDALEILYKAKQPRQFTINVQPQSFIPDDLYQGFLVVEPRDVDQWLTALLPFERLLLTGRGQVKVDQRIFDHGAIKSVGLLLRGEQQGDFELQLKYVKAVVIGDEYDADPRQGLRAHRNPPASVW